MHISHAARFVTDRRADLQLARCCCWKISESDGGGVTWLAVVMPQDIHLQLHSATRLVNAQTRCFMTPVVDVVHATAPLLTWPCGRAACDVLCHSSSTHVRPCTRRAERYTHVTQCDACNGASILRQQATCGPCCRLTSTILLLIQSCIRAPHIRAACPPTRCCVGAFDVTCRVVQSVPDCVDVALQHFQVGVGRRLS